MKWFVISICLMLAVACKSTKQTKQPVEVRCGSISVLKELTTANPATVVIDTLFITNGELHAVLRAKGCNRAENIQLAWTGATMKSYPPRVSMKLLAEKTGDNAVQSAFHLCFELKTLHLGEGSGKIYIGIEGSEQKLLYEY